MISVRENYFASGVQALGAPVFNFRNEITMALVVVGIAGMSDLGEDSAAMQALQQAARTLSAQLGSTHYGSPAVN